MARSASTAKVPEAPKTAGPDRQWHIIDADGQVLGRVASKAARILQGKHKPTWAPYLDRGDHVVIINAARVRLTGRKEEQKIYRRHSGYEGGLKDWRAAGMPIATGGESAPPAMPSDSPQPSSGNMSEEG